MYKGDEGGGCPKIGVHTYLLCTCFMDDPLFAMVNSTKI